MRSKKRILTQADELEIIRIYQSEPISAEMLAKKFNVGKIKIISTLNNYDIPIKKRGGQIKTGDSSIIEKTKTKKYLATNPNKKLVVICKRTGKEYNDANNSSGILTQHILKIYGDVPIPQNTYQRKKYEKECGKKWFEEFFTIKELDIQPTKKCPYCEWETIDVENKSGAFQQHLINEHEICLVNHLNEYPDDIEYFNVYKIKQNRLDELSNKDNCVICEECGGKFKFLNNSHLLTHGLTTEQYKVKHPNKPILSKYLYDMFSEQYNAANLTMKPTWTSKGVIEVKEFIESLGFEVEKARNRSLLSGKELDIIIPSVKLAIEYNGLYYHTERMGKNSSYHLNKTIECDKIGYKLIHIFEDEWLENSELVKAKIGHILGLTQKIIHARKCVLKKITNEIKNGFLGLNHIQGSDTAKINYGAFYVDELVAVMSFKNKRNMTKNDDNQYELSRFATKSGYKITGIASRLLKLFISEHNPSSIISFADRRWTLSGLDNLYTKLGFELVSVLPPDYSYYNSTVNRHKRLHKFGFGKNNIKKRFPHLDFSKSEKQLMTELGYDRIWNCGLFKYIKKL